MEWRLFIDSSSKSSKAVLLNNGKMIAAISVANSVRLTENCGSMKILVSALKYSHHNWNICGHLKLKEQCNFICFHSVVRYFTFQSSPYFIFNNIHIIPLQVVSLILGMQEGYTKYPSFLCLWDTRADDKHYLQNEWPSREILQVGSHNEAADPLVKPHQIMLPPLHKKLGLMKNFVKVINKESPAFAFIKHTLPQVSDAKLKAGIFDGPQIRSLMKDENFNGIISETERNTWQGISVANNFLGNKNYWRANAEF